jgi:hypothetical protein
MHLLYYVNLVLFSLFEYQLVICREYHYITTFSHCNLTGNCCIRTSVLVFSELSLSITQEFYCGVSLNNITFEFNAQKSYLTTLECFMVMQEP